ncbi:MAG: T9SS type A sorting domain-containing protein [Prolixibacteraceae bacterium]|jgi:hypothetical protein|nr:T9SS type A sorting domain-containing protein [Prolixibacteraceae bacterium]
MLKYTYIFFLILTAGFYKSALPAELFAKQNPAGSSFVDNKMNFNSFKDVVNVLIVQNDSGWVDQINIIDLLMENESEVSAFQFDLVLPDGFSVVTDSCELTDRANGHSFSISKYSTNIFRFVSYSGSLKTYFGTSGSLVQVALQTEQDVSPGIYSLMLQNVVLSDVSGSNVVSDAVNGQFNVLPATIYDTVFASICERETYEFGTKNLTTAGEYNETFEASNGADSVVTLNLIVYPNYAHTDEVTICQDENYEFGSQSLATSGEYTEVFQSVNGCDSTVMLTLTVLPAYNHTAEAVICEGESYQFGTQTLNSSGEYTETFETMNGCDSTVTLTLTVDPVYNHTDQTTICEGETYEFGSQSLTTSGEYTEVFPSVEGCDSTVTLTLTVYPTSNHSAEAVICQGETYQFGTQALINSGEYTETFETVNGCDSTVTLTLTVNPVFTHTEEATICEGESYEFGSQSLTASGEYTEVFESENGCDSTVTLTLTVYPTSNHSVEAVICQGETYQFGTQTLTASGLYTETFETVNGCDSIVSLTLTVNPGYTHADEATICEGENYQFGSQSLTTSGEYTEVFESENGCDSIVTLTITVYPTYNHSAEAVICQGETYQFGMQTLTTSGEYIERFKTVNGCDSTVTLTLIVNPVFTHTDEAAICEGENYQFGSQSLTASGEYTEVFESENGCDSTVTLTLTVYPTYNHSAEAVICEGETYQFGSQILTNSGEYTETFETVNGCDSTVTLTLTVNPVYTHTKEATICKGETYEFGLQSLTISGEYTEVFQSVNGCDSVVHLFLTIYPVYETVIADTITEGDTLIFGDQIVTESGEYTEMFNTVNGCDSTVILQLFAGISTTAFLNQRTNFSLGQNYPNPFNTSTIIPFELDKYAENVILAVYDIKGRVVQRWHLKNVHPGSHKIEWNAEEIAGVYLYKINIQNKNQRSYTKTKRMITR